MEDFDAFDEVPFGSCPCGSAWFGLDVPPDAEGDCPAAVAIDLDGNITNYAGILVCIACDAPWNPSIRIRQAKGHLRVVE